MLRKVRKDRLYEINEWDHTVFIDVDEYIMRNNGMLQGEPERGEGLNFREYFERSKMEVRA